ncbi:MAG: hypothetical protein QY320_07435 [Gammaproteobacteria bacterium]|nr:MAG: hypothetical protein QY320_07435 [Gammaproteobacteria bacterium]
MSRAAMYSVTGAILAFGFATHGMAATPADATKDAIAVVQAFNDAFSRKDVEGLVANLIEGGVQFDLQPAHADQGASQGLTQELIARWYGVTPILFAGTESYLRKVKVIDSKATAEMATVWAEITTEMRMPKADKTNANTFTEVYLLIHTPKGWKIGAMMDNRATDNISTSGPGR